MNGDLILRVIISFLVPFLLLFGFFILVNYNTFGFYSLAFGFVYFLLVYLLLYLRHKTINANNLIFFRLFGRFLIGLFMVILFFILGIIINLNIGFLYDYIKF